MFPPGPRRSLGFLVVGLLLPFVTGGVFGATLPTTDPAEALSRAGPIGRGDDSDAARLLGIAAPALPELRWLDGRERNARTLEGRVVIIRSFTNECPFCASTMPTLQRLHARYRDRGLTVLGVYHPKPPAPTASEDVAEFARSLGATFPVAVDEDWNLVTRWWKAYSEGTWTSITWVLDRKGVIRWVHPGGEYHDEGGGPSHERCRSDLRGLERLIGELLADTRTD
jgi:thiol-disulfide isomerase/thioredoxin